MILEKLTINYRIRLESFIKLKNRNFKQLERSKIAHKKVKGLPDVFSFRITRRYRVLFYFQNINTAIFFEVDHRKYVYR